MSVMINVFNGPNLGRLGSREPEIYGVMDFAALVESCTGWAASAGAEASVRQTDDEAELISWIAESVDSRTPVVLNPAAFTHYSYALRDACAQLAANDVPLIEVHISNPASRESFRAHSVISAVASGTIAGFGFDSYRLAIAALAWPS